MKKILISFVCLLIFTSAICQEQNSKKDIESDKKAHLLQQISPYIQIGGLVDKKSLKNNNLSLISTLDASELKLAAKSKMYVILKKDDKQARVKGRLYKIDGDSLLYIKCKVDKQYYCAINLSDIEIAGFETLKKRHLRIGLSFILMGSYAPVSIVFLNMSWIKKYDLTNTYKLKVVKK